MKKGHIGFLAFASIAGVVLLLVLIRAPQNKRTRNQIQQTLQPAAVPPAETRPVHLYFSDREGQYLIAENRVLRSRQKPEFFARSIIQALIKGPQQGLARTLPAATAIRAIFMTPEGICFVDLTSAVTDNHPGGIQSELLTIYSIVNSLVLNVPQIKSVKILINGTEAMSLAGHIDLQIQIKANMLLIR